MQISNKYMLPLGHPNRCGVKLSSVEALVIHWTANLAEGADDIANARYFGRAYEKDNGRTEEKGTDIEFRFASAHYVVDQDSIQLVIPENEKAYHVGSTTYTTFAKQKFTRNGVCQPNSLTIGIEMCVNKGNDWVKTCELSADLASDIMIRHNLSMDKLIRHFDVTGKDCPKPFVDSPKAWADFKALVAKKITAKTSKVVVPTTPPTQVKSYPVLKMEVINKEAVTLLQKKLQLVGWNRLVVDGDFGLNTDKAVKEFQTKYSLGADGIVGSKTWTKLDELLVQKGVVL